MFEERFARCTLAVAALLGLIFGGSTFLAGYPATAGWIWTAATIPVVIALAFSIVCDFMAGRISAGGRCPSGARR